MEIKGLTTSRGGKVHIHFGKEVITNLWDNYFVIDDLNVIKEMQTAIRSTTPGTDFQTIRAKYSPLKIGHQYSRPGFAPQANATYSQANDASTLEEKPAERPPEPEINEEEKIKNWRLDAVKKLRQFFSEFTFTPAARFVNAASRQGTVDALQKYISGYVKLINNPDANAIMEKMKSPEFAQLAAELERYPAEKSINNRLDIYFGDAGTGKTTQATQEYPDAPVIPCNASVLPDELLRTFDFNDENGNPVFKPSTLRVCMEQGKPIIFDEINLLSFDCLRLLQTLTDNKDTFDYNGDTIRIQPGFKVIGTMNLTVNEQVYSLPEPLVDRANTIKEFELTDEDLTAYAFA